jgi:hypothetical protein
MCIVRISSFKPSSIHVFESPTSTFSIHSQICPEKFSKSFDYFYLKYVTLLLDCLGAIKASGRFFPIAIANAEVPSGIPYTFSAPAPTIA